MRFSARCSRMALRLCALGLSSLVFCFARLVRIFVLPSTWWLSATAACGPTRPCDAGFWSRIGKAPTFLVFRLAPMDWGALTQTFSITPWRLFAGLENCGKEGLIARQTTTLRRPRTKINTTDRDVEPRRSQQRAGMNGEE